MPTDNTVIDYGEDKLKQILTHFKDHLLLDVSRAISSYQDLKLLLRQQRTLTLQQVGPQILTNYSEEHPDFAIFYQLLLVLPVTSVACERGVLLSKQNQDQTTIKTSTRHSNKTDESPTKWPTTIRLHTSNQCDQLLGATRQKKVKVVLDRLLMTYNDYIVLVKEQNMLVILV